MKVSLLSWERGLKYLSQRVDKKEESVAPLVGAWIEMLKMMVLRVFMVVAPLVGAWIEIPKSKSR